MLWVLGYVGLSNAVLLAQHNEVIGVDISQERVDALNARKSPIIDGEMSKYLIEEDLKSVCEYRFEILGAGCGLCNRVHANQL